MSRALIRLTEQLSNKPHLISQSNLDTVISYLADRNSGVAELKIDLDKRPDLNKETVQYNEDTKIGLISIDGSLTYLSYAGVCGDVGVSYKKIKAEFDYLIRAGAEVIVLDQDSNGGEAYMAFETAREMRRIADEKGVKLISYVDGVSYSASYVFSAICHEIIINPQAEVGSIGVVVSLLNRNKAEKNAGYERTYITSGKSKVPFDAAGEWDETFIADMQDKVSSLYDDFTSHVSLHRDISVEKLVEIGARTFMGTDAVELNLADRVMTHFELGEYLANIKEGVIDLPINKVETKQETQMSLDEAVVALASRDLALSEAQAGFVALQEEVDAAKAEYQETLKSLQASLDEALASKAEMVLKVRKERLEAATSTAKAAELLPTMKDMSDETFDLMVGVLASNKEAAAETFEEIGGEGEPAAPEKPKSKTLAMAEAAYQNK